MPGWASTRAARERSELSPHSAQHRFSELQLLLPTFRPLWERPSHPKGLCQIISGCPVLQTPNFCKRPIPRDHATVGPATFPFQPLQHKRSSAFLISSIQGSQRLLRLVTPTVSKGTYCPQKEGATTAPWDILSSQTL